MVAQWCGGKGIPHATLHPPEPIVGSLQSAVRKMRYRLLWHWCGERGLGWLITAHHADDQIETMLMRLRSEEHTSELQSLMRISYAVFCSKNKTTHTHNTYELN